MKKIVKILTIGCALGLLGGAAVGLNAKKEIKAEATAPSYTTYVPVSAGWVENTDGSAESTVGSLARGRNDRFWNGGSGFDSQERTFNAMDEFVDTIHRANGGEGWRGAYRTPELELVDNDHRYISFLFGGGAGDIFVNIFQVSGAAGSGDRIAGIPTAFNLDSGNGDFGSNEGKEDSLKKNAPISCNMVFKYFELPVEIQPGDHFLIYVRDGKTSDYGGFTFGDVHINLTLEEVAKHFSVHKQQVKLNEYTSAWNRNANEFVLNYYATDSYYETIRNAEALLTDADCDFDVNDHLTNWAHDRSFSEANIWYNDVISENDAKNWTERMPANKSGDRYFNSDASGIDESEKYRLVSSEFTLSGTGFISAKLGGGTAVMSLIDDAGNELVSSRIAAAEGTNILNGGFADNGGVDNIMASGSRYNTMSRTYLDASAHVGKKVRVVLSDERTGGNWGLAYFDEVITKYDTIPTLKVDRIEQQFNESPLYHGVVTDKYVGSASTNFGKAYAFMQLFYEKVRNVSNGGSRCVISAEDKTAIDNAYKVLDSDVKAIINASDDYDFGQAATSENWFLTEASVSVGGVGTTLAVMGITGAPALSSSYFNGNGIVSSDNSIALIIIVASAIAMFGAGYFVLRKRKQN